MGRPIVSWNREATKILPALRTWRAALHREPELANTETRTREKLVGWLEELGLRPKTYDGFTGVSAVLAAERSGTSVALRADMDALAVDEATGLPFSSKIPGLMHACGHDVHMACVLGAAALLGRHPESLDGPVKLLFQPAEEQGARGGALPFIEHGCLEQPKVDYIVGQHVEPGLPLGTIGWKKGPMMASADHFVMRVQGTGGHAAWPHRGADAVLAASEIVVGLQALVSRRRDPLDPVVISVGMIHGGRLHNVLPAEVVLEGTVRTFLPETRDAMERMVRERSRLIARSLGGTVRIEYHRGYPVLVNPPAATEVVVQGLVEEFGESRLVELERPVMGAEDFSRYLEHVPGTFLFLGVGEPGRESTLHSATFLPQESVLVTGTAALAAAVEALQRR